MRPRSPEERLRISFAEHPDWDDGRRSKALKVPVSAVRAFATHKHAEVTPFGTRPPVVDKQRGKTLAQFRALFDVRERIRAGLKTHLNGDIYMGDQEFREVCGISAQDWRRPADLDEFGDYRWRYKGLLYWAQPKTLAAMKETVGAV